MEKPPPSPPQEPTPKKLKMSCTTTSDEEHLDRTNGTDGGPTSEKKPRYKRRKIAIFFAYCGVGYQGMQKNPGAKTIEGDLEEALFHSGAVPEHDRGCPKRFDWARSARTDKGVSAVGQVVSGRFYIDPPGLVDRLNSILPSQIRIFGFKRVTASFSAKKFCDRRRYVYLIPVFALDPSVHRDRESVEASLGSGSELIKCVECSERGRKVAGLMGRRKLEPKDEPEPQAAQLDNSSNNETAGSQSEVKQQTVTAVSQSEVKQQTVTAVSQSEVKQQAVNPENENVAENSNGNLIPESTAEQGNDSEVSESKVVAVSDALIEEQKVEFRGNEEPIEAWKKPEFSYGEKEKERFNGILKRYEGTHNFHNFTTRTKAEDPSALRYIISFDANTVVTVHGIEFVKCEVVGQSFMLHQIRKMIGLAVAVMRNCAPESLFEKAFEKDVNINVPTAPEVGLFLDECFFTSYNQKWKDSHEELSMKSYAKEAEEFKIKYIYSHIASTEHNEGVVALWLHSLNHRNYPDLLPSTGNGKAAEAEKLIVE